jgi:hypothetical protein
VQRDLRGSFRRVLDPVTDIDRGRLGGSIGISRDGEREAARVAAPDRRNRQIALRQRLFDANRFRPAEQSAAGAQEGFDRVVAPAGLEGAVLGDESLFASAVDADQRPVDLLADE